MYTSTLFLLLVPLAFALGPPRYPYRRQAPSSGLSTGIAAIASKTGASGSSATRTTTPGSTPVSGTGLANNAGGILAAGMNNVWHDLLHVTLTSVATISGSPYTTTFIPSNSPTPQTAKEVSSTISSILPFGPAASSSGGPTAPQPSSTIPISVVRCASFPQSPGNSIQEYQVAAYQAAIALLGWDLPDFELSTAKNYATWQVSYQGYPQGCILVGASIDGECKNFQKPYNQSGPGLKFQAATVLRECTGSDANHFGGQAMLPISDDCTYNVKLYADSLSQTASVAASSAASAASLSASKASIISTSLSSTVPTTSATQTGTTSASARPTTPTATP